VALVGGAAVLVQTRLRRGDARTGWLIAVGGSFLVTAVAFSQAQGIFHPYYVSALAPLTAGLVGAAVGVSLQRGMTARIVAPLALLAGIACELVVLGHGAGGAGWTTPLFLIAGLGGAAALAFRLPAQTRAIVVAAAFGALLLAPASWAVQTLGHATSGTFPTGGSANAAMGGGMGGPGRGGGMGGAGGPGRGGFGGVGGPGQSTPPTGAMPMAPSSGVMPTGAAGAGAGAAAGGGMFGGDSASLTAAIAYAKANGGGVIGVSSQSGAATAIIRSGAQVAGIGGFSGRESEVSAAWLANAVQSGRIRWVLNDQGSSGMPQDSRVGSKSVMTAVAKACTAVSLSSAASSTTTASSSTGALYDCAGRAGALRAAG
jgi:hypothetical protein